MKISICVTTLNEEHSITTLLQSLVSQTLPPQEIIISDGGSSDNTVSVIKNFLNQRKNKLPTIRLLRAVGNRSVGRNRAIRQAKSDWIAITDAGCTAEKHWLAELAKRQKNSKTNVVAGYYAGLAQTPLQEAITPYVLVMPDKVDENNFLPATRSMLIKRSLWQQLGGFDESLSDNEDYAFARRLRQQTRIAFARDAIVYWQPRQNLFQFAWMIFRFARGDIFAGIVRPKVALIFLRHGFLLGFLASLVYLGAVDWLIASLLTVVFCYSIWAIAKNWRYCPKSWHWLPVLQVISDQMVMLGSLSGWLQRRSQSKVILG